MYEAVYAYPTGRSTVARYLLTARWFGYTGLVFRSPVSSANDMLTTNFDEDAINFAVAADLRTDSIDQLSGLVREHRHSSPVLLVHGGSEQFNRFVVEQDQVDVLTNLHGASSQLGHVEAKAAANHGVRLELSFEPVLRSRGGNRVREIIRLRRHATLIKKFDVPYVVSANPKHHLHLRSPRDLDSLATAIGFSDLDIQRGLCEWGTILESNLSVRDPRFVEPGVKRGSYVSSGIDNSQDDGVEDR